MPQYTPFCAPITGILSAINVFQSDSSPLPSWLTLINSYIALSASPSSVAGTYNIVVRLVYSDLKQKDYNVEIVCLPSSIVVDAASELVAKKYTISNIGPPYFLASLDSLKIEPGSILVYSIPHIQDPDEDPFTVSVNLGSSMPFAKYYSNNHSFVFQPSNSSAKSTPYRISVILEDRNLRPKKQTYILSVDVPMPPKPLINPMESGNQRSGNQNSSLSSKMKFSCQLKLYRATKDAKVSLRVISSSSHAAILLAKSLNESNFQLILTTKNQSIINFQKLEASDSASQGIVELKLNYSSVPEISMNVSLCKLIFKEN